MNKDLNHYSLCYKPFVIEPINVALNLIRRKTLFTNGYEYFKTKKEARIVSTISFFLECLTYAEKRIKKLNLNFLQPFVLLCVRNTIHSEASVINYLILLYLRDVGIHRYFMYLQIRVKVFV